MLLTAVLSVLTLHLSTLTQAQENGDIRIVDRCGRFYKPGEIGNNSYVRGRLEIYYNSQWGSVCYHGFNSDSASRACDEYGFSTLHNWNRTSSSIYSSYREASPTTPIWQLFNCPSPNSSTYFPLCQHRINEEHNCTHSDDTGVTCAANSLISFNLLFHPPPDCSSFINTVKNTINFLKTKIGPILIGVFVALLVIVTAIIVIVTSCVCVNQAHGLKRSLSSRQTRNGNNEATVIP